MGVVFVIVGITGDLAKRKLLPALYQLTKHKVLKDYHILGIGTRETTEKKILSEAKEFIPKIQLKSWEKLCSKFTYVRGDVSKDDLYERLLLHLRHHQLGDKDQLIYYLATLPSFFPTITNHLAKHGLQKNAKIVFEKPFGEDLASAKHINKGVKKVFPEKQIYRVDHYLGKELVQDVAALRFTNTVLEPVWNAKYIEQVQIVLSEEIGVGTRGKFYDKYGALKDVLQNHMLQLLALTAMEQPKTMRSDTIREEKARVLEAVKPVRTVLGQYGGYRKEKDVKSSSSTETLAAVEARVHTKRWKDVPFYLLTGKKLKKKQTSIYIQFKNTACKLFEGVCPLKPNHLVIQIQPDEGFYMVLNGRAPGGGLVPVKMDFCHKCTFGPNAPEAYENVFRNVLKGDQTSFVRSDEVESSWKFIESIHKTAPHTYTHLPPKEAELTSWFLL